MQRKTLSKTGPATKIWTLSVQKVKALSGNIGSIWACGHDGAYTWPERKELSWCPYSCAC